MLIDCVGGAIPEHIDHANCRTTVKMDNLWECLVGAPVECPDLVPYGPVKYCVHKDHVRFDSRSKRLDGLSAMER
jgi:hypothetical protein